MRHIGKRVWVSLAMGLLAVPLSAASLAYACTGLATLSTSAASAAPGDIITVSARGFSPHDPSDSRTSPAELRMDSMTGPVIGTASPSSAQSGGNFSVQITVPKVEAGDHVLIATQTRSDGRPSYGTPARTVLTVTPTPPAPQPAAAGAEAAGPPAPPQAAPPQAAPTPAAPQVAPAPKATPKASQATTLARAVERCTKKYNVKKAKTRAGKKRTAARLAVCIKQAKSATKVE